jgi:hypothetical protein
MIKTYGLHWRKIDVFWGRQRLPATLLGQPAEAKRGASEFSVVALYIRTIFRI